jgi:hypothetical protein
MAMTLSLPAALGAEDAETKTKNEAAAKSLADADAAALTKAIKEGTWRPTPADIEAGLVDRATARKITGAILDGADVKEAPEPGSTLRFGPGVHTLDAGTLERRADRKREFPADLVLEGAGMNSTLLRLAGNGLQTGAEVRGFTVRDLTLAPVEGWCGPFDLRGPSAAIALERVRVVGYDCGAGGSVCFDVRTPGAFVRAVNCEFLAGFGRSPWSGHCNLAYGSPFVARFDSCRIEGTALNLDQIGSGAVLFKGCTFALAPVDPLLTPAPAGVRFTGCTTESVQSPVVAPPGPKRELAEWFPQLRK